MASREREIVKRTRELLTSAGAKVIRTCGEGEPDLVGVYKGIGFAIECKQRSKKPTDLQNFRLSQWRKSGAVAFWTDFPAQALIDLDAKVHRRIQAIVRNYNALQEDLERNGYPRDDE
jgi:Holliday junction resolvase